MEAPPERVLVIVADIDEAAGTELASELGGAFVRLNVSSEADWSAAMDAIERLDVDVDPRCAGIQAVFQYLLDDGSGALDHFTSGNLVRQPGTEQ